jgi:alkylhydroperoxidase family enzyme
MLAFAEKLSRSPWLVGDEDRSALRRVGLDDRELLHVVLGCAIFNYLNRMADGLGIVLEYATELPPFEVPESARAAPPPTPSAEEPRASVASGEDAPTRLFDAISGNPAARDLVQAWRRHQLEATPRLSAHLRATIALEVSRLNGCAYSASCFERRRIELGGSPANRSSGVESLLAHAERLTREPWTVREPHIVALRGAGLDDAAILQLTMLASYVNFENRAVAGLGVELERGA